MVHKIWPFSKLYAIFDQIVLQFVINQSTNLVRFVRYLGYPLLHGYLFCLQGNTTRIGKCTGIMREKIINI